VTRSAVTAGLAGTVAKPENPRNISPAPPRLPDIQQYLVITAVGEMAPRLTEQVARALRDTGCSITESRMAQLGNEFALITMVSGTWDAIAKTEDYLPRMARDMNLALHWRRTTPSKPDKAMMPYAIDVVCCDRPGVVHDIAKFMADNDIHIQDMYTNSYMAAHTQTQMFSLHMTINIPTNVSIAGLRGDFMDFCDRLNLDAIMEPVK
jgi:glycine cleavage system transcriptional repressor